MPCWVGGERGSNCSSPVCPLCSSPSRWGASWPRVVSGVASPSPCWGLWGARKGGGGAVILRLLCGSWGEDVAQLTWGRHALVDSGLRVWLKQTFVVLGSQTSFQALRWQIVVWSQEGSLAACVDCFICGWCNLPEVWQYFWYLRCPFKIAMCA